MTTCEVMTGRGKPCRQSVDVFPCRYHNAAGFNAVIDALGVMIAAAGGWKLFIAEHSASGATVTPVGRRRRSA